MLKMFTESDFGMIPLSLSEIGSLWGVIDLGSIPLGLLAALNTLEKILNLASKGSAKASSLHPEEDLLRSWLLVMTGLWSGVAV